MDKKVFTRREFLKSTALVGGGIFLTACAPQTLQNSEDPKAEPASQEIVEIEFWNPMSSPANKEIFPKVFEDFMTEYPNIKVNYEISGGPPGGGNFIEVILAHVAAGNPPDTAMFWSPATQFAAKGILHPIDDYMTTAKYGGQDKWLEMPFASCQWQGKTYALPTSAANLAIFLNGPMFEDAGISMKREDFPTTWDGLKDLAAQFTKKENGTITQAGFVPWANTWYGRFGWFQSNGGGEYDEKAQKYTMDKPQNVEVVDYWVQWLDELYDGNAEAAATISSGVGPDTWWWMGKEAMCEDGSWAVTNSGELPVKANYEVVKYPIGPSGTKSITPWGPNWEVVLKGAKHPYEGFLFNEYFCTVGWMRWYKEGCPEIPAWKDAPRDVYNTLLADYIGVDRAKEQEAWLRKYLEEGAASEYASPIEDYASDIINSAFDEALHKVKTPAQALGDAQKLCQTKLEEVLGSSS